MRLALRTALLCVVLLGLCSGSVGAQAQLVYFGQTDTANGHATRAANYVKASLFENTAGAGTVTELGIMLFAGVTGRIRLGVYYYIDGAGSDKPGYLRLDAGEIVNPVVGWNTISGLSLHLMAGERVWLAWANSVPVDVFHNTNYTFSYASYTYGALPNDIGAVSVQAFRPSLRAGVVLDAAPPLAYTPLTPGFSVAPHTPLVGIEVHFTDLSAGDIISWLWDFGDGTTSTERHPSHTYTTVGAYEVTLTITDSVGNTATLTR